MTLTPLDDAEDSGQYGMGVHVSATVNLTTQGEPDPSDLNAFNTQLALQSQLDSLGHVAALEVGEGWVPQLTTFVPIACWAGSGSNIESLASVMVNLALHAALPADQLA